MAFVTIDPTIIEAGDPVTTDLLTQIKDNSDDHETRINAVEGSTNKIQVFNELIDLTAYRVGEIRASLLTETQFKDRYGGSWQLMSGQSWTGLDIGSLYGTTAPDFVTNGRFLRQTDTQGNIGNTQANQYPSHSHGLAYSSSSPNAQMDAAAVAFARDVSGSQYMRNGSSGDNTILISSSGSGSETRPETAKVNFFIRQDDAPLTYLRVFRAPADLNIVSATISNIEAGASGSLTVDLKKGTALGSLTTMLNSDIALTSASGDHATSSEASFNVSTANQNDFISLDVTATQPEQYRFYISVYAEPA